MQKPVPYLAYLIRLWPTERGGMAGCRVSLEDVATGERKHLPDLEGLFAFLRAREADWRDPNSKQQGRDGGDAPGEEP